VEQTDEEENVVGWKMCDVAVGACAKVATVTPVIFGGRHSTSLLSVDELS
jgi:hypothetical protein